MPSLKPSIISKSLNLKARLPRLMMMGVIRATKAALTKTTNWRHNVDDNDDDDVESRGNGSVKSGT